MDVEDVDVVCLEFFEGVAQGDVEGFGAVACVVGVNDSIMASVVGVAGGVFRGDDHLVAETGLRGKPFANPSLGLLVLVVVGCVDEIAALTVEEVEEREDFIFG